MIKHSMFNIHSISFKSCFCTCYSVENKRTITSNGTGNVYHILRANVGIYRESQISSEKSNFGLYHPNNPLVWLFQKMILKNAQAPCIWINLEKFENSQKNTIFIHEISHNFERFQRNSTGAKDLLLTSSSSHV